ncbi:MAG: DUF2059 domain-containing protein [Richelia sp.]|nr:DUF2059 domain-containing protein [Richelia sp.]
MDTSQFCTTICNFHYNIRCAYPALYSKDFTNEEIKGLIAFYETPLGRKTISVMPKLLQESILLKNMDRKWHKEQLKNWNRKDIFAKNKSNDFFFYL